MSPVTMTCAEFKEVCAAYVLGAVDEAERNACADHLAQPDHDGCPEALASALATVHTIPLALQPLRPRASVWEGIARQIAPAAIAEPTDLPRRRRVWPVAVPTLLFAAAAAAAIVLFLGRENLVQRADEAERALGDQRARAAGDLRTEEELRRACQDELGALQGQVAAQKEAVALLTAPGAKLVALAPDPKDTADHRAIVILDAQHGRAAIVAHGLAAPSGKDYELWVIKGDAKKAAGLLHSDASGGLAVVIDPAVLAAGVDAFAITLEPTGGGTAPTGPIVLVGLVSKA